MQIQTGTASVTNGSAIVVASTGNDWSAATVGSLFAVVIPGFVPLAITAVRDPAHSSSGKWEVTLATNYPGATNAAAPYIIHVDFSPIGRPILKPGDRMTAELLNIAGAALETTLTPARIVLGAAAGVLELDVTGGTFTVPGRRNNLRLTVTGRSSAAVDNTPLLLRFNGVTSANYEYVQLNAYSNAAAGVTSLTQTSIQIGGFMGTSAAANVPGSVSVIIPEYAGTTFLKTVIACGFARLASSPAMLNFAGLWNSTAAITGITLFLGSGNFVTGTTATLIAE